MTNELRAAIAVSAGLHAAVLVGMPFTNPVEFDVERAPTSVEIVILAKPTPAVAPQPQPEPPKPEPASVPSQDQPEPQTVVTPQRRGALTELLPSYLRNPAPVYPYEARQQGWEGAVIIEAEVLPSGRCGQARVMTSSGYRVLDESALQAIRRWQFKPATRGAVAVSVWVEIPVTFRLTETAGAIE